MGIRPLLLYRFILAGAARRAPLEGVLTNRAHRTLLRERDERENPQKSLTCQIHRPNNSISRSKKVKTHFPPSCLRKTLFPQIILA